MSKLSGIKAIGFDLDDTLFMTEEPAWRMENEVVKSIGATPITRELHQATWGMHILEAIALRSPGIDVEKFRIAFEKKVKEHFSAHDMDPLTDTSAGALAALGNRGFYLFALTGRDGFETAHLTRGGHPLLLHLAPEDIFHRDNLDYPKPDPRSFEWLKDKGFEPRECLYVGDSISDGQAATSAGLNFVATLESGIRKKTDFKDIKVAAFINDLSELPDLIA